MATSDVELGAEDSIGQSVQFLLDCNKKGRDICNQCPPSIFMVPSAWRDLSPTSFTPRVVSIGPLHKQKKLLQGFEDNKMAYLHQLLNRSRSSPEQTLQECMNKVSSKMNLIKACYAMSTTFNDVELARMMVIDGCFILNFIHLYNKDQIPFHDRPLTGYIINDLVLIENQIPFFVLKEIFESIFQLSESNASLTNDLCALLAEYNIFGANNSVDASADHILGILHKVLQPRHKIPSSATIPMKHSAMELDRAGVNFRPNEDANSAMTMTLQLPRFSCFPWFWSKPTLKMPKLYVDDRTEMILRNLLIYEQSSIDFQYITSYASAIDMLIDTAEDVDMLEKSGVLVNGLGSNEMAADMINNICREIYFSDFLYHQEWEDLDTYYNNYWPNAVAGLKRTYFSSPWSVIALFAGIVLFVLTVIQTTFQIKAENPIIVNKQ